MAANHGFPDRWHEAAAKGDCGFRFGSTTMEAHGLGTDATETRDKTSAAAAFSKLYVDNGQSWGFKAGKRGLCVSRTGTISVVRRRAPHAHEGGGRGPRQQCAAADGKPAGEGVHRHVLSRTLQKGEGGEEPNERVTLLKGK